LPKTLDAGLDLPRDDQCVRDLFQSRDINLILRGVQCALSGSDDIFDESQDPRMAGRFMFGRR
jgi:hypothetical protein